MQLVKQFSVQSGTLLRQIFGFRDVGFQIIELSRPVFKKFNQLIAPVNDRSGRPVPFVPVMRIMEINWSSVLFFPVENRDQADSVAVLFG